jgi:hypothetical protein
VSGRAVSGAGLCKRRCSRLGGHVSFFVARGAIHFKCFLKSIQFFLGSLHFWWDLLIALVGSFGNWRESETTHSETTHSETTHSETSPTRDADEDFKQKHHPLNPKP